MPTGDDLSTADLSVADLSTANAGGGVRGGLMVVVRKVATRLFHESFKCHASRVTHRSEAMDWWDDSHLTSLPQKRYSSAPTLRRYSQGGGGTGFPHPGRGVSITKKKVVHLLFVT